MSKINAEQIKELRNLTQAGMAACKDALTEAAGDMNKAVDIVKAKGLANVNARSSRVGSEGRVVALKDGNKLTLVEVNCQTDFVANSEGFRNFVEQVSVSLGTMDLFKFGGDLTQVSLGKQSLEDLRKETCAATGENVVVRRWAVEEVSSENAAVAAYVHSNAKIGVAVSFEASDPKVLSMPIVQEMMSNVAMQIAAMNPVSVSRDRVAQEELDRQKAIFETQLRDANKPEVAWAKILDGKFNKWFTEVCLLDQESVMVAKKSVGTVVSELAQELGCELKVLNFVRLQVGEGIEKKTENLAEAVAAAIGG
jgi:elongation factor Ts